MKRDNTPRYRLMSVLCRLHRGDGRRIAARTGSSEAHVSAVLNGKTGQNTDKARNIIRVAEDFAQWRNRLR